MELKGQVALVTGASMGIGKAIALALAQEGADIAIGYHNHPEQAKQVAQTIHSLGCKTKVFDADFNDPDQATKLVDKVAEHFGKLTILINNAGTVQRTPALEISPKQWQRTLNVNLVSAYACAQRAAAIMQKDGRGKIINIVSLRAIRPTTTTVDYAASKAALLSLTQSLAIALAPAIQVNAISPGFTLTDMNKGKTAKEKDAIAKAIPMQRWATPQDIANICVFLVSSKADYLTGQHITVDGGHSLTTR